MVVVLADRDLLLRVDLVPERARPAGAHRWTARAPVRTLDDRGVLEVEPYDGGRTVGRAMVVLVGAVVAVQAAAGTAHAAPSGRLAGSYDVVATTASSTSGAAIGASYYQTYALRAACGTGVCASRLTYVPDEVTTVRVVLRPTGSAYAGSSTYAAPCFRPKGGIRQEGAYTTTEEFVVNVSRATRGVATAFTGTDQLTSVLTDAGRAAGCAPGGTTTYTLRATRS